VRGGWPALYAANRRAIGPDPNAIRSGTVLVVPGPTVPIHYTVAAGDTLSGIAAEFAVRGGWTALYAANRRAIGPDPNAIHSGTVLTLTHPAAPSSPTPARAFRRQHPPALPPSPPTGSRHHRLPVPARVPPATGMPQWLKAVLVAVGLLILGAILAEPVLDARGRQRAAARRAANREAVAQEEAAAREAAARLTAARQAAVQALAPGMAGSGSGPACWRADALKARIVVADYDRVVVTRSRPDDTVYVLRPPGEDPRAILRVARLVLPEGPYGELAKQLGMPAIGPVE